MSYLKAMLQAPDSRLGMFRAAVGVYLSIYLLARLPATVQSANSQHADFVPVGLVNWLGLSAPLTPGLMLGLYALALLSSIGFLLGAYFTVTGPLCALSLLWVTSYKSSFGMLFHSENLFVLQTLVLGFSPAARAFSWDAQRRRDAPAASAIPAGWPVLACCLIAIFAYVLAGIAKLKLGGGDWLSGTILREQIAYDNLRKLELGSPHSPIGAWSVGQPWLFAGLAGLTMLAELAGPLALLHKKLAWAWIILIVGFHWGVLVLMAITFSYPLSVVPFLCFLELEKTRVGKALLKRMSPRHGGALAQAD